MPSARIILINGYDAPVPVPPNNKVKISTEHSEYFNKGMIVSIRKYHYRVLEVEGMILTLLNISEKPTIICVGEYVST